MLALYLLSAVRLSATSQYCIEMTGRNKLVFGTEACSTYPTLCYKKIRVSAKITVLPSGTLSQTPTQQVSCVVKKTRLRRR